jgi:hypothetical protein
VVTFEETIGVLKNKILAFYAMMMMMNYANWKFKYFEFFIFL